MLNSLSQLRNAEFHGVRELAQAAEAVLRSAGTSQEKGTVAEYPNERTIRYYITEGLLDQAIKRRGVTSVFGYDHLITLLTIKKLQADGLPISVIKSLIRDKITDDLEKLLGEEVHVFSKSSDLDAFRSAIGHTDDSEVVMFEMAPETDPPAAAAPPPNEAKQLLESFLFGRTTAEKPSRPPARPSAATRSAAATSDWRRYEIVPGVELHLARHFKPPADESFRQRILVLIDGILHSRERR
jgi:DNA-binding transcriptional MerR regulator